MIKIRLGEWWQRARKISAGLFHTRFDDDGDGRQPFFPDAVSIPHQVGIDRKADIQRDFHECATFLSGRWSDITLPSLHFEEQEKTAESLENVAIHARNSREFSPYYNAKVGLKQRRGENPKYFPLHRGECTNLNEIESNNERAQIAAEQREQTRVGGKSNDIFLKAYGRL